MILNIACKCGWQVAGAEADEGLLRGLLLTHQNRNLALAPTAEAFRAEHGAPVEGETLELPDGTTAPGAREARFRAHADTVTRLAGSFGDGGDTAAGGARCLWTDPRHHPHGRVVAVPPAAPLFDEDSTVGVLVELADAVRGRIALNAMSAVIHPDAASRHDALVRVDAYRLVLLEVESRINAEMKRSAPSKGCSPHPTDVAKGESP
jgi:hypothetical protein